MKRKFNKKTAITYSPIKKNCQLTKIQCNINFK